METGKEVDCKQVGHHLAGKYGLLKSDLKRCGTCMNDTESHGALMFELKYKNLMTCRR